MQFAAANQAPALFQMRSGCVFDRPIGQEWTRSRMDPLLLPVDSIETSWLSNIAKLPDRVTAPSWNSSAEKLCNQNGQHADEQWEARRIAARIGQWQFARAHESREGA
jgi:hypothetical protein